MPDFIVVDDDLPTVTTRSAVASQQRANRRSTAKARGREVEVAKPSEAPESIPDDVDAAMDDLAAVVVNKSLRALAAGKLQPTLRDGLTAQQLLDRRAEKAADRRFMLTLTQAMAGGGYSPPQKLLPAPDEVTVEGEFTEVEPDNLAPAHLRSEP